MSRRPVSKPKPAPLRESAGGVWLRTLLLVIIGLIVYANSLSGPFVFDDDSSVVGNRAIRSVATVLTERVNSPLTGRPLVGLSFAINFALGGLDVRGYHLTNIAIHLCCALLLFGIVRRTLTLPRMEAAYGAHALNLGFAVALLWMLHPLNTETVNYITQRTESLMALFYLLTLYASIRGFTLRMGAGWQLIAVAACALGMACKESMVTAPVMVVLYDRIFLFTTFKDAVTSRWRLYGGLATTWLLLAYLMLPGPRASTVGFSTQIGPWTYLVNQADIITRYLWLAFWPHGLVMIYGPPLPLTLREVWPQALLIVSLLGLTIAALRWRPALGFLGAWIFVTLAPTSTIVPIASEVGAERRMYLPLMALIALVVIAVYTWQAARERMPRAGWTVALVVMAMALSARTMARNEDYASRLALAESVVRNRDSAAAHGFLGSELSRVGRDADAIAELREGARVEVRARYNLGAALFNQKRYDEAIQELQILVDEHPLREETPWSRRIMGHAYANQGKWTQAVNELRLVLSMTPGDAEAKALLVDTLTRQGLDMAQAGRFPEAVAAFRQAVELDPKQLPARRNLTAALLDSRDPVGAENAARAAIAVAPTDAGSYEMLGMALALQGKMGEAETQLEQALKLSPDDAQIRDELNRVRAQKR